MTRSLSKQGGLTFISFILLIGFVGFFAMLGIKLIPVYLEHYKVVSILKNLESDKDLASRSRDELLATLDKRWNIDMVESVTRDNVTITKDIYHVKIEVAYDVSKPILGNVDAVMHFYDSIEVQAN